ncbi:MAG TPA: lysophospholipid acyltransferase family protein, partial [Anaeromyxobacter sp.]
VRFVAKKELLKIPVFGWALGISGHIVIDRGDPQSAIARINAAAKETEQGMGVLFYAEGTRSRDGTLRPFRPGPFKLAVDAGVPIVPVAITGAGEAMPPDQAWIRPARIRVRILPPIATAGLRGEDVDRLREETRRTIAAALAEAEAPHPAPGPA